MAVSTKETLAKYLRIMPAVCNFMDVNGLLTEISEDIHIDKATIDAKVIDNILPPEIATSAFEKIKDEVVWQKMMHRGGEVPRLIGIQGTVEEDGTVPVYRHPADTLPKIHTWSKTVNIVRKEIEKHLGHPLNHALIQYYRDGKDFISEHSDKTIDIAHGTKIVNLSLGATRTMILRTKKERKDDPRYTVRFPLDDNSLFVLGLETNKKYMHSIKQDKRPDFIKSDQERFQNGERISLTFRHIATFMTPDYRLFGQGAIYKTRHEAQPAKDIQEDVVRMLHAFSKENHDPNFNWEETYGGGFNVINCKDVE